MKLYSAIHVGSRWKTHERRQIKTRKSKQRRTQTNKTSLF